LSELLHCPACFPLGYLDPISANVNVSVKPPLIPVYAPVPEPATIGVEPVARKV